MKIGYLYIALSTILFSTMEIALKSVSGSFHPLQIVFLRFLIGGIVLLPFAVFALKKRGTRLYGRDIGFFALTGFLCVVVSMTFFQLGVDNANASTAAVLFSCNPVFVIPLARIFLKEKITANMVLSVLITLGGMAFIVNPLSSGFTLGVVCSILAAATFALYSVVGKKRTKLYGGLALTCFSFLIGSLIMLGIIVLGYIPPVADWLESWGLSLLASVPLAKGLSMGILPQLLYIAVGVTGLGYTFYFLAMEKTSAVSASLVFFIKPALAPILALLLLHEPIGATMWIGIGLILAGSAVTLVPGWRKSR